MRKQLKVLTAVLCSAAVSLNMVVPYLQAEISPDKISYKGLPISDPTTPTDPKTSYFPDTGFQLYLKTEVDEDKNGFLSDSEIEKVKEIDISGTAYSSIAEVTGIEVFSNLERFICNDHGTTALQLKFMDPNPIGNYSSANAKLKYVSCNHSNVTTLDLTGCPDLEYLNCSDNYALTSLDLTKNPKLEYLYCSNTGLTDPKLTKNTELKVLDCSYKEDTTRALEPGVFNPTAAPALTNLDLTSNVKLEYLDCSANSGLAELKLASDFDDAAYLKGNALKYIDCHGCGLTSIDLQYGTLLQYLNCSDTNLTALDTSKNTKLEYLDCSDSTALATLTLGEDSILRTLDCSKTKVTSLNLTNSTALETLNCAGTDLTELDLSKNTALESLLCEDWEYNTATPPVLQKIPSKITTLKLNRLLYKKAGLSFNEIFDNMSSRSDIVIDYDSDSDSNVDIYYTGNALDIMNVVAKDITKPAKFKEGASERTITYTDLNGEAATVAEVEKQGDYTLADCTHLFKDINRADVINGEPVILYSNGVAQTITLEDSTTAKKNSGVRIVYTDIAASYKVNDRNKAITGKVIVGVTDSTQIPTVTNNKIEGTSTLATAKIKNGEITIKAVKNITEGGVCYLWIIDTGSNGTYECCPINVLGAPKKLEVRNEKDNDPQLKDATRMVGEELEVCIAGYLDTGKTIRTMDSTYSYSVPDGVKDCVEITKGKDNDHFIIKAKAVNNGKDTKVPITFKCDQNKQKIKFTLKVSAASLVESTTTP